MSSCSDCISGARHEGQPEGKIETIGGLKCYVATPTVNYPKDKAILLITDVFGVDFPNNQLLADDFARNGFKVVMPDYLKGEAIRPESLNDKSFSIDEWKKQHPIDQTRFPNEDVIRALKADGTTTLAAIGYCYGARAVFDLAFDNLVQYALVAHATGLKSPDDFNKYLSDSKAPLLIINCEVDHAFPAEFAAEADRILGDGKFTPGYKRVYFEGCRHGFAVRADLSNPVAKAGKEGAFKTMVEWLKKTM